MDDVTAAKELLETSGYVVLKAKSYRAAQERQRITRVLRESAEREAVMARQWAYDCLARERRLAERVTEMWGLAVRHGATAADLAALNAAVVEDQP